MQGKNVLQCGDHQASLCHPQPCRTPALSLLFTCQDTGLLKHELFFVKTFWPSVGERWGLRGLLWHKWRDVLLQVSGKADQEQCSTYYKFPFRVFSSPYARGFGVVSWQSHQMKVVNNCYQGGATSWGKSPTKWEQQPLRRDILLNLVALLHVQLQILGNTSGQHQLDLQHHTGARPSWSDYRIRLLLRCHGTIFCFANIYFLPDDLVCQLNRSFLLPCLYSTLCPTGL